jgi:hypothetical protein
MAWTASSSTGALVAIGSLQPICLLWIIFIQYHLWTIHNVNGFFFTLQEFILLDDGICKCIVRSKWMRFLLSHFKFLSSSNY